MIVLSVVIQPAHLVSGAPTVATLVIATMERTAVPMMGSASVHLAGRASIAHNVSHANMRNCAHKHTHSPYLNADPETHACLPLSKKVLGSIPAWGTILCSCGPSGFSVWSLHVLLMLTWVSSVSTWPRPPVTFDLVDHYSWLPLRKESRIRKC